MVAEGKVVATVLRAAAGFSKTGPANLLRKTVRSQMAVLDGTAPAFYVFNYTGGGWTIVAADRRLQPVMAYSATGSYTSQTVPGVTKWENDNKRIIRDVRLSALGSHKAIRTAWRQYELAIPDSTTAHRPPPDDPTPTDYVHTVGPLLATEWSQNEGYNFYCPPVTGAPANKAWTGCVPTAMAQVMRFYQYPASYNWSIMPDPVPRLDAPNEVGRLMYDIFSTPELDIGPNDYDVNGTGARSEDISETLKSSRFRYHSSNRYPYNYLNVKSELSSSHPVILDGCDGSNCHAWVCDGYEESSFGGTGYLRFHMNWGWGGTNNGWYSFDNWTIFLAGGATRNYSNDNDMVINIRP